MASIGMTSKRTYVALMMHIIGRAMQALSEVDEAVQEELRGFPDGLTFEMTVWPGGPGFALRKTRRNTFEYLGTQAEGGPDLKIKFKHLEHAYLVLTFQEGTARAFANDRMTVDGEISHAIRMVRCMNQLEAFILPKLVAARAVKRYPEIGLLRKLTHGGSIYGKIVTNLVQEVVR